VKRLCALLTLITVMSPTVAGAAAAHQSPTEAAIALRRRIGPPLTRTSVRGEVFGPSETVTVAFDGIEIASAQTNEDGVFTARIVVPRASHPGSHDVVATGATSGLTAQTNFLVRSDWTMERGGPDRSGRNPLENVLDPTNAPHVTRRWSALTTGAIHSSPVVAGELAYVGTKKGDLVAVDRFNGEEAWSFHHFKTANATPAVVNGVVFLGDEEYLYALDARTGQVLWQVDPGGYVDSSPAVEAGVVYVSVHDYGEADLYAFDAATGTELWRFNPEPYGSFSPPAVADGLVFVGSVEKVYAVDAETGIERWEYDTSYWAFEFAPAVVNGTLFVASSDGNLYAFDPMTGDLRWKTFCFADSSPAVSGGIVYVNGTYSTGLDAATGAVLWQKYIFGIGDPVVANGVVYLPGIDRIYLVRERTGMKIGLIDAPGSRSEGPTVVDGMIYVGSKDWHLYALGLPDNRGLGS
jgi:outer membrane protein assembly factor BamB